MSKIVGWGIFIFIVVGVVGAFSDSEEKTDYAPSPTPAIQGTSIYGRSYESGDEEEDGSEESYYGGWDYESEHGSDVSDYQNLGGSYTVEACNSRTGSCYDLDADIDDGEVERIYFPNGGHLDLDGAELDEDGYASGESYTENEGYDGDEWEINCSDCE